MALFQQSVLNKYLKTLEDQKVNEAFDKFKGYFQNPERIEMIRSMKEEEYQDGFLDDLFINVLGYTKKPNEGYNLERETKNVTDSKKADGSLIRENEVIAVIELKGTKTVDFAKIETQAFGYKRNHAKCAYVITSNFEKLRFYIQDAIDSLEFDLFKLSEKDFKLLYLCLSKDHLFTDVALKIKTESTIKEEDVTKKLYKDYSNFKKALFNDLVALNPNYDQLVLFKKSQKLIDRFLFIFFAEDKGLLPPNSITEIVNNYEKLKELDFEKPLIDVFKQYFGYINSGREKKGAKAAIFAYNGGLFAPDEVLDHILISDEVLKEHTLRLTAYDFESEVDVNILGHIFEHSLNEIDEMTAQLEGQTIDKSKTKRKKDGVFYTPKYITKYIVDNTVGKLCEEQKTALGFNVEEFFGGRNASTKKKYLAILEEYRAYLLSLTICDPACGSGAFLNQALDFLIKEHHYLDELKTKLLGGSLVLSDVTNDILENNIYGVDINDESVDIARLSLWLRSAQKGRALTTLSSNIKCGNSLIDDPEVAGGKAFSWEKEFPEVFERGGFDVIIGNPPYVFARDNMSSELKGYYTEKYVSAEYQVNTYLLFIEQTIKLIRNTANYGLIIPNAWLMVSSARGLRKFILEQCSVNEIINLAGYSFEGVGVETIIIIAAKTYVKDDSNNVNVLLSKGKEFLFSHSRKQIDFDENEDFEFRVFSDETSVAITKKLKLDSKNLDELAFIRSGLKAYQKGKGKPKQTIEDVKNRPYDYDYKFDDITFPYLEGRDIGRYFTNWSGSYLRFGPFLAEPRSFPGEKIIVREITGKFPKSIIATYSEVNYLFNMSNIAITKRPAINISLKYVLVILNSQLLAYYFVKNTAKSVRKLFPKIILNDLRKFPFKEISETEQEPFIEKANTLLSLNRELRTVLTGLINYIQSQFKIEKLPKKIQNWDILDFADFIKELNKAIRKSGGNKLSKLEEMEWMEVFKAKKSEADAQKNQLNKTENEINQMVYELYGLTEEEIKIVESK